VTTLPADFIQLDLSFCVCPVHGPSLYQKFKNLIHLYCIQGALALFVLVSFFWLRVLDKAEYSAFESTLNSTIVSYRIHNLVKSR